MIMKPRPDYAARRAAIDKAATEALAWWKNLSGAEAASLCAEFHAQTGRRRYQIRNVHAAWRAAKIGFFTPSR